MVHHIPVDLLNDVFNVRQTRSVRKLRESVEANDCVELISGLFLDIRREDHVENENHTSRPSLGVCVNLNEMSLV
jgi:hypothetical protein